MATETSEKVFTLEEVAKHNTKEDLWMVINGKVYDTSSFLDEHPGGEEVMIDCGGTDATEAFEDIGHSEDAREMLEPLLIGVVPASEGKSASVQSKTSTIEKEGGGYLVLYLVAAALIGFVAYVAL